MNFLLPFEGTPLGGTWELNPRRCLRILAMVRLANPAAEVRLAAGREVHLRHLQGLALQIVNSIFLGDYLTSEGQEGKADLEMIADAGFEVEGAGTRTLPAHRSDGCASACGPAEADEEQPADRAESGGARTDLVTVRRRGAGTDLAPNA